MKIDIIYGVIVIIASIADALLTVSYLKAGGVELNPLMGWALSRGPLFFWSVKMGITVLGVGFLIWVSQTSHWAHKGLFALVVAYLCLLIYHMMIWR